MNILEEESNVSWILKGYGKYNIVGVNMVTILFLDSALVKRRIEFGISGQ